MRQPTTSHREGLQSVRAQALRTLARGATCLALVFGALSTMPGCAVSDSDVRRWETTERGPEKLVAVLTHDKYSWALRTEAALSLVRMKPRGGRRIGHELLVQALNSVSDEARRKITNDCAPELIKQITATRPPRNPDGTWPVDPSIPYKDAAFALLSHKPSLVPDPKTAEDLSAALMAWTQTDFDNRIDNTSQRYGIEQMLGHFGSPAVRGLPAMIHEDATRLDRICALIADLGDAETKEKASVALAKLLRRVDSNEWAVKNKAIVEEANRRAKATVDEKGVMAQVARYQDQEVTKVFSAMKKVGGRPVVELCISYAADRSRPEERRKAALAAVEGRVDKNRKEDIDKLFTIALDDGAPDALRDLAFMRLGELPREILAPRLYPTFDSPRWKTRWMAASLLLKTMTTRQIPDFMRRLPSSAATRAAMTEFITYGTQIARLEPSAGDPSPRDQILPFLSSREMGAKLTALSFFYGGKKSDAALVQSHANDRTPVSRCEEADDCGWVCSVPKEGNPKETEAKAVTTIGDFVRYCVLPSLEAP